MPGNSDPEAPTGAHHVAYRHHHEQGEGSSSPSSSASSSPRVASFVDHKMFDNPTGRRVQGSAGAASASTERALKSPAFSESATAPDTDEDPDPYPLWPRPSAGTTAAKPPRRPSSSSASSSSSSLASSSSLPRVLAPSSSSSSSLSTVPTPAAVYARQNAPCQYPGCPRDAKYGEKDETPIACQAHKKAGQFTTNRHGELLRATRDGDAFRALPAPEISPPPASTGTTGTARKRSSDGSGKHSSSRKEATPSSSPRQGVKRKNRPRLSSVDDDESPASQDRSCLFPGCDAQPVYGLTQAVRPVYCFSHKKGPMVQLVHEAPGLRGNGGASQGAATAAAAREGTTGKSRNKPPAVAVAAAAPATAAATGVGKPKSRGPPATANKGVTKKARGGHTKGDDYGDGGGEQHTRKDRGNTQKNMEGGSVGPKVADLSIASDNGRGATADDVSPRPSASSRMADITGMAPSTEILLLQQAREAAKKEAEAGGGRRRARAPSRRALEAAGRMTDQGAQWMTQEKKEEQARAAMELREQRKRYRAAGLKAGVVLEEFVVGQTGTATVIGAAGAVGGGGDSGPAGGGSGIASTLAVAGWQKVSPVGLSGPLKQAQGKAAAVAAGERP